MFNLEEQARLAAEQKLIDEVEEHGFDPIADYLENNENIGPALRGFVARYLRGEVKRRPGIKRSQGAIRKEKEVLYTLAQHVAIGGLTVSAAIDLWLKDSLRESSRDALQSSVTRAKHRGDWQAKLDFVMRWYVNTCCLVDDDLVGPRARNQLRAWTSRYEKRAPTSSYIITSM